MKKLFVVGCNWEIQKKTNKVILQKIQKIQEKKCLKLNPSRVAWRVFVCGNRGEKIRKKDICTQKFQHIEYRTSERRKKDDI